MTAVTKTSPSLFVVVSQLNASTDVAEYCRSRNNNDRGPVTASSGFGQLLLPRDDKAMKRQQLALGSIR